MSRRRNIDMVGMRFGFVVVTENVVGLKGSVRIACDCGKEKVVAGAALTTGSQRSCGMGCPLGRTLRSAAGMTHGESVFDGDGTREHHAWHAMIGRCHCKTASNYERYGGRGITVCEQWRGSYVAFLHHVGRSPSPSHSIHRIDNDGNYEPGNVKWATASEQARARSDTLIVVFRGRSMSLADACDLPGTVKYQTAQARIARGWSDERALTEPPRHTSRIYQRKVREIRDPAGKPSTQSQPQEPPRHTSRIYQRKVREIRDPAGKPSTQSQPHGTPSTKRKDSE